MGFDDVAIVAGADEVMSTSAQGIPSRHCPRLLRAIRVNPGLYGWQWQAVPSAIEHFQLLQFVEQHGSKSWRLVFRESQYSTAA